MEKQCAQAVSQRDLIVLLQKVKNIAKCGVAFSNKCIEFM
jgi:hypothetical protein